MKGKKQKLSEAKAFWLSDDGLGIILYKRIIDGKSEEAVANDMGIAYSTLREWSDDNEALSAVLKVDKKTMIARFLKLLIKCGQGGKAAGKVTISYKSKRKDGDWALTDKEEKIETAPPNAKVIQYLLENMDPDHFKSKIESTITGADGGPVQIESLTGDALTARIKELQDKLQQDK